jgi:multisubunit Na+/H+ antiporter MnhC subunit
LTADYFDSVHPLPEVRILCSLVVEFCFLQLVLFVAFVLC